MATTRRPGSLGGGAVQEIVGDVLLPQSLGSLPKVDTVLYAIGFDRASGASMRSVYVEGLVNVLERLPPPAKFIYVSSSSVYGQSQGEWVDEESPTEPEEESGRIVLAAEKVLRDRMPDAIILRFAGIYGPGRLLRQKAIEAGEPIVANENRWLNLIHVDDGARAVLAAEHYGPSGRVYNVSDCRPVPRRLFYTALAKKLGAPSPRFLPPALGMPTPPHEKANRRIANKRLREELGVDLQYPSFDAGIAVV
jgi:nucleoside-diphosphate-sugar epimerase